VIEQTFELKAGQAFIELNKLLKIIGIAQTGGHAKLMITNKEIKVNGVIEIRIRNKLRPTDQVEVGEHKIIIV
jgi:ribosome-associated protein